MQDLLNCLVLSETSYKVVDMGRKRATEMINRIRQTFPQGAITTERVQWSLPSVFHRYRAVNYAVLCDDSHSIYDKVSL